MKRSRKLTVAGIVNIISGIHILSRKKWAIALAGSVCAIPGVLGIASTIIVGASRNEFVGNEVERSSG